MNQSPQPVSTSEYLRQGSPFPKHNPYAKMNQRRAIACTICAKAKTKCDKAVPSCSRCTAKGLQCEPRSTRRTSDSSYRSAKQKMVSPKRFHSSAAIPTISRNGSPRSVPSSDMRHPLARSYSQMDMSTAMKQNHRQNNLAGMPMLTPLQTYTPQIIDECWSDYGSPEPNLSFFPHQMENKSAYNPSGRLTPQTPDSLAYSEPLVADPYDYVDHGAWSDDGSMPIGLGLEGGLPGMLPSDADMRQMWSTPEPEGIHTPMQYVRSYESPMCESPASFHGVQGQSLSVSPPQPPHTRSVPSLSISDTSVQDFETSSVHDEWQAMRFNADEMNMGKPSTSMPYMEGFNGTPIPKTSGVWDEAMLSRSSTF